MADYDPDEFDFSNMPRRSRRLYSQDPSCPEALGVCEIAAAVIKVQSKENFE
jgi:hypothetical protein